MLHVFHVGGLESTPPPGVPQTARRPQWDIFVADEPHAASHTPRQPFQQVAAAQQVASAGLFSKPGTPRYPSSAAMTGDVVMSAEAFQHVSHACIAEPLGCCCVRLAGMVDTAQEPPTSETISSNPTALLHRPLLLELLRMHIDPALCTRIEAGYASHLLNELRRCTVAFVGFPSLQEPCAAPSSTRSVQTCIEALQEALAGTGGTLLQTRCDEKGFLAVVAFGLPGSGDAGSVAGAAHAALCAVTATDAGGQRACVGLTTGDVLCAVVGCARRAEYTVGAWCSSAAPEPTPTLVLGVWELGQPSRQAHGARHAAWPCLCAV